MNRRHFILIAITAMLTVPAPVSGLGRDSDGSRMQARPISLGSTASDRLAPPADAVDWRYVRLSDAADVTVSVTTKAGEVSVTVTDAMGKSIARGKSSGGNYSTRRRLDPGLYYVAISSARPLSYSLTIR